MKDEDKEKLANEVLETIGRTSYSDTLEILALAKNKAYKRRTMELGG